MGCDIHMYAERKINDNYYVYVDNIEIFDDKGYAVFGFLANVRNYSNIPPIVLPRGFPDNASDYVKALYDTWGIDAHTPSWITIEELTKFDYEQKVEDVREEKVTTYQELLGSNFINTITTLKNNNIDRIVFWFDN